MQLGVDFREGGKPENPEKNSRSTGEINYDNSIRMSPKFEIQHGGCTQMVTHPATDPVHRINTQPEVRLRVSAFDVGVLVFSAAAIFLANVHGKCLR